MHGTIDHFQWTEARIADLKAKIDARLSASEAAEEFGISRGAVIGKAHRMGWAFDSADVRNVKHRRKLPRRQPVLVVSRPRTQRLPTPAPDDEGDEPFIGIGLMQLTSETCHSPNLKCDDPAEQTYCGHQCFGTLPYCAYHARKNYMQAQTRNREPRPRA